MLLRITLHILAEPKKGIFLGGLSLITGCFGILVSISNTMKYFVQKNKKKLAVRLSSILPVLFIFVHISLVKYKKPQNNISK